MALRALELRDELDGLKPLFLKSSLKLDKTGRVVPVRWVGEQHVKEDLGFIPSVKDWLENLMPQKWMRRAGQLGVETVPSERPEQGEPS